MPIHVSRVPGEPILVAAFEEPMNYRQDVPAMFEEHIRMIPMFAGAPLVFIITDTTQARAPNFSEVMLTLSESRVMRTSDIEGQEARLMLVGTGGLIDLAAKALSQLQYGGRKMRVYSTLEEALTVARAELAEPSMQPH